MWAGGTIEEAAASCGGPAAAAAYLAPAHVVTAGRLSRVATTATAAASASVSELEKREGWQGEGATYLAPARVATTASASASVSGGARQRRCFAPTRNHAII